ncbi:MAG: UDP-2,3-diacylglucosamine diphosphatase, partial [Odoribacter sp.]|nr:UDP-2,3-diacylglucosamine diphosphatase [Odoribacter sp.]
LESVRPQCSVLFLLGDIFDFWFEYKRVIPKGFVRFLAKICEFTDSGVQVHFFTGNHDIWAFDYLQQECGVIIHTHDEKFGFNGKKFYIGHGDGLDPHDKGYLFIKKVFHNPFLQHCFKWIHPDLGIAFAHKWSSHSRLKDNGKIEADAYRGSDKEDIELYCRQTLKHEYFDYFIFGHRHLPLNIPLSQESRYINTGDWISHYTYAVFDGAQVSLKKLSED